MTDFRNVMIYGEAVEGRVTPVTRELLSAGKKLADDLGEELHLLFTGDHVSESARQGLSFGAKKVYVVEDPLLGKYQPDLYLESLVQVVEQVRPRVLLLGHNEVGADLGPRLAFRLKTAIATDCVALEIQQGTKGLLRTKPVYGGLVMAVYRSEGFPQMATVRPKSMTPADSVATEGEILPIQVNLTEAPSRVRVLDRVIEEAEGIKLEDAAVIVSGGRGMGGAEGFKELEKAAKFLNGSVGGSRVAVDNGWIPTSLQVGLTGTIVAPKVYIAIGISGASQHMTGCSRSQRVVAINKDANAPIFKQAHFGVVGDWKAILPAFIEKLRELG